MEADQLIPTRLKRSVRFKANRIAGRNGRPAWDADDLEQEAYLAALVTHRAGTHDPAVSEWETYISLRIAGAMLDHSREMDWVPRLERRAQARGECEPVGMIPLSTLYHRSGDHEYAGNVRNNPPHGWRLDGVHHDPEPADDDDAEFLSWCRETIGGLSKDEKTILVAYYVKGLKMWQIGELLGVGESRVSQMHSAILRRVRDQHKAEVVA